MAAYLNRVGIEAFEGGRKRYSTDANLAGISYEAEELEAIETPSTIVEPQMGCWPHDAPDELEQVSVRFEAGCAKAINGEELSALDIMQTANKLGGRNGIGLKHALENRIVGTKSRGVYEAPGMELLAQCLAFVSQAVMDRRATGLYRDLSSFIAFQVYDGRYFDPATRAAQAAVDVLVAPASGTVTVGLYKGNLYFHSLAECPATLYNEADSSMEASEGLNPVSSQGYAEIQSVEAKALARAGQIL
jgi:argininosuccinate synthase